MFTYKALNLVDYFRRAASCIFICSSIMDSAPILPLLVWDEDSQGGMGGGMLTYFQTNTPLPLSLGLQSSLLAIWST